MDYKVSCVTLSSKEISCLPLGTGEWVKATPGATETESWVLPLRDAVGGGVVAQPLLPARLGYGQNSRGQTHKL